MKIPPVDQLEEQQSGTRVQFIHGAVLQGVKSKSSEGNIAQLNLVVVAMT